MEGSGSYGTSWADQWDSGPDPVAIDRKTTTTGGTAKYKQKVGEGLGKTKGLAKTGVTKLKQGTSVGLNWIKTKYNNTTHKPWPRYEPFCLLISLYLYYIPLFFLYVYCVGY